MTSITVAIPFYINSSFVDLKNCIKSINDQYQKPQEIIIVVNGRKISTKEKNKINYSLKALIENIKLKIFYLEKSSISKALNLCISKSNCEWICRMDADDKMLSNRISSFNNWLSKNKKNNLWIFYSQIITLEDGKLGGIWKTCSPRFLNIQLSITNPILHVSVFFKKEIVKQIGCYRDMPKVEDYDLWLRLYKYANQRKNKEAFIRCNLPLVAYNIDLKDSKESMSFRSINFKTNYQIRNLNLMPFPILTVILCIPINIFCKIKQCFRPISYKVFKVLRFRYKLIKKN
tara:strand:+ start:454 stop:1320 length:867 start_codon:yes stop_codon:yes gene_type:complete